MKQFALLPALAGLGLGLAAVPAHAQGLVLFPATINPTFNVQLPIAGLASDASAFIQATDANAGRTYDAGLFAFDSANGQLDVLNDTAANVDPSSPGFADPTYNIATDLTFTNLALNETFADGSTLSNVPLFADPAGLDPTTQTNALDTGTLALFSAPLSATGPALTSATLTGTFDAGQVPGQPVQVQVAFVPEPAPLPLLLLGLGLVAAPRLRARLRHAQS